MRVIHVISSISRSGGGPSRSSQALVSSLCSAGCDAWLLSCREGEEAWIPGINRFASPRGNEDVRTFLSRILDEAHPDLLHLHGIWQMELHWAARSAYARGIPYVISPRGMLEPWSLAHKKWKKRLAMFLYQRRDLLRASALHATAASEHEQFRKLGFCQPCIVSPNGVVVPRNMPARQERTACRKALFLSRMHPKKGVMELVDSWAHIRPTGWVCELVYTVRGEEEKRYEQDVRRRVSECGLSKQFVFVGALDDEQKWEAYSRADLFVLPTYSENFGIVVAEALWAGVPVITTKGTPWSDLVSNNCGWWIDTGVDALVEALKDAFSRVERGEHVEMGKRGRELIEHKYTWEAVVGAMKQGYEQILNSHQHVSSGHCSCV